MVTGAMARSRWIALAVLSATFLAGSMLCGAAQSMTQLIIFRAIQGMGGGGLMALAFTVIADVRGMSAMALHVALQTSHRSMPNIVLDPQERADVVAYILSLKSR